MHLSICKNKLMKPGLVEISKKVSNLYFQCQDSEKCYVKGKKLRTERKLQNINEALNVLETSPTLNCKEDISLTTRARSSLMDLH